MATKTKDIKPPKKRRTLKEYERAILMAQGCLADAAKTLGVSKSAVTQRVQKSKRLQKALEEAKEFYEDEMVGLAKKNLKADLKKRRWRATKYVLNRYDTPERTETPGPLEVTWVEPKDLVEARPLEDDLDELQLGGCQAEDLGLNGNGNGKNGGGD